MCILLCLHSVLCVCGCTSCSLLFHLQRYESRVAELEDMVARQSEVGSLNLSDEEEDLYGMSCLVYTHCCMC